MPLTQSAEFGAPLDTGGILIKADVGATVDNIFIFQDTSGTKWKRVIDGAYRAAWAAYGTGDKTSVLQAVFNNATISTVIFDSQDFEINGTLTVPSSKTVKFEGKGKLIGTGTLSGAIISAGYQQNIFATTLNLVNCSSNTEAFSVRWFGAKGDNINNDYVNIQRAIDLCIANNDFVQKLYIPPGKYKLNSPLIIQNWTGSAYGQVSLHIYGDTRFWPVQFRSSELICTFKDTFAIGIQLAKGVRIEGLEIIGAYTVPAMSTYDMYASSLAAYGDVTCRDTRYSPYAAIVIDPFRNVPPPDGGYPGLTANYRGTTAKSGSTGVQIYNVVIRKFTIGVITSPNGWTQNAELITIDGLQIQDCKIGIAGCQDQEKDNFVRNFGCWGSTHTVVVFNVYGVGDPGHWIFDGLNIAGNVVKLVQRNEASYFPCSFINVFAESLGSIGTISLGMGSTFRDSTLNFRYIDQTFNYPVTATGTARFENCSLRYYGSNLPLVFNGMYTFSNCKFEVLPIVSNTRGSSTLYSGASTFTNCGITGHGGFNSIGQTNLQTNVETSLSTYQTYGKNEIIDGDSFQKYQISLKTIAGENNPIPSRVLRLVSSVQLVTIIDPVNRTAQFSVSSVAYVKVGKVITFWQDAIQGDFDGAAVVTAVDSIGLTFTVKWISSTVLDGSSYYFGIYYTVPVIRFLGDTTAGSAVITNVTLDGNGSVPSSLVNQLVLDGGSFLITAVDDVAKTITTTSTFALTESGRYFGSPFLRKEFSFQISSIPAFYTQSYIKNKLISKGSTIKVVEDTGVRTFDVVKSGWIDAASSNLAGDTRYAHWVPVGPYYVTASPEGNTAFPRGVEVINSTTGDRYYKSTTTTAVNGGNTGWKLLSNISEISDIFTLVATGSRSIAVGQVLTEIYLNPTVAMTIDIGTAAAGIDIQDQIVLPAGVTTIVSFKKKADSAFSVHFTGVTGGTLNITLVKKIV